MKPVTHAQTLAKPDGQRGRQAGRQTDMPKRIPETRAGMYVDRRIGRQPTA